VPSASHVSTLVNGRNVSELDPAGMSGPSAPRSRALLVASLAALVLTAAAGVVMLLRGPTTQVRVLPDGSRVVLESFEYRTHHEAPTGSWWQRLLGWRVTRPLGFSNQGAVFDTPGKALVFWLSQRAGPARTRRSGHCGVLIDEHGCWFRPSNWDSGFIPERRAFSTMNQFGFEAFPRRSGSFTLGLYQDDGIRQVTHFSVPNPAPGRYPRWNAARSAPVTVRQGSLTFTLARLNHLNVHLHLREDAVLRVTCAGRVESKWQPQLITVTDATGNVATTRFTRWARLFRGPVRVAGLCRRESAWKVTVSFAPLSEQWPVEGSDAREVEFLVRP
jgi:hypothetical protein